MNSSASSTGDRRVTAAVCAALVAAVAALYWPVGGHGFVNFDDPEYVYENARVRQGLTADNVGWALTTTFFSNWHPLTWLSHLLDVSLFGVDPGAHHLVSLALHAVNAVLLFLALASLGARRWPSAAAAALFAVHPLHVESVAWLSERKDLLSFLFGAVALLAYSSYARRPSWPRYAAVLGSFALGLMAKPMLVTLPFVLLLVDVWPLGRLRLDGGWRGASRVVLEKVPLLLLSAGSSVVTMVAQRSGGAVATLEALPPAQRVANALVSYVGYLEKTLWPSGLSPYYPFPTTPYPAVAVAGAALLLVAVTALVVWQLRARPYLAVGWFWYLGTLVPVIGVVQVGAQAMADRYTYLPLVGIFLAAACGVEELARTPAARRAAAVGAGLLLVALAVLAHGQVRIWKDSTTLFQHALAVTPGNWLAHMNLGKAAMEQGGAAAAIAHFEEARRLKPDAPETLTNLGTALATAGRRAEAEAVLTRAVERDRSYANGWYNLGVLYLDQGRKPEALAAFGQAERLAPGDARAPYYLAVIDLGEGRFGEAATRLRAITAREPDHAGAQLALGVALASSGQLDAAIERFRVAARLRPGDPAVRENLEAAIRERSRAAGGR